MFGLEESVGDGQEILLYGITPELIVSHPELKKAPAEKYAEVVHSTGGLVYQAHPYRARRYVKNPYPLECLNMLDGIEVYNGHKSHDSRNTIADAWADRFGLRKSSGSDFHDPTSQIDGGILIGSRITTQKELKDVLLSSEYKLVKEYDLP